MGIEPGMLLDRMAARLRHDVGPAVSDEFARTQAFMASVILTKLSAQLRSAEEDAAVAEREHGEIAQATRAAIGDPPADVAVALDALEREGSTARWSELVTALYASRDVLGATRFDRALTVVRGGLRARLDRALRYSR